MALSHDDLIRLTRLLAMFGSDYDGEVVNAARAAQRLIKKSGETWESVIANGSANNSSGHSQYQPQKKREQPATFHAEIHECLKKENLCTGWERQFLNDMLLRMHLSEKQRAIINRIKEKIAAYRDMNW